MTYDELLAAFIDLYEATPNHDDECQLNGYLPCNCELGAAMYRAEEAIAKAKAV